MISIIIPTYNEEDFLPILLESIKKQSYKDYEIIVADNNSTDRTRFLAKKEGARVVNGGLPAKGRNNGARVAQGDWLLFLDADVVLPANFLIIAINEIKERNLLVASCLVKPISNKKVDIFLHDAANIYMKLMVKVFPHASGSCIFSKTKIYHQLNGFNEKIKLAEDHDYVSRAKKIANFGLLKKVKIPVSVRRLDKDGRLNIITKYVAIETHLAVVGPVYSDLFKYKFGYKNKLK